MIFANCFVGIPLPLEVETEVRMLQQQVAQIIPSWEIANTKIMHLTMYYLGSQKDAILEEVVTRIAGHLEILRGEEITLGGLGYFTNERPKVVFLRAEYSTRVDQFYRMVAEEIAEFRKEDVDRDFYGHVTLGRLISNESVDDFLNSKEQLERICSAKKMRFPISELGIYVLQSGSLPSGQRLWRRLGF